MTKRSQTRKPFACSTGVKWTAIIAAMVMIGALGRNAHVSRGGRILQSTRSGR